MTVKAPSRWGERKNRREPTTPRKSLFLIWDEDIGERSCRGRWARSSSNGREGRGHSETEIRVSPPPFSLSLSSMKTGIGGKQRIRTADRMRELRFSFLRVRHSPGLLRKCVPRQSFASSRFPRHFVSLFAATTTTTTTTMAMNRGCPIRGCIA